MIRTGVVAGMLIIILFLAGGCSAGHRVKQINQGLKDVKERSDKVVEMSKPKPDSKKKQKGP